MHGIFRVGIVRGGMHITRYAWPDTYLLLFDQLSDLCLKLMYTCIQCGQFLSGFS